MIFERIGPVAYHLELSRDLEWIHDVFHVWKLRKHISDPLHVLETLPIELREDRSFKVQPIKILGHRKKVLRNKVMLMVKVLWRSDRVENNCNSSKNPLLVIHIPFPKWHLTNHLKSIYSCYGFLEHRQEPIKRTSLNTRILIVVFNEILIPQDFFSMTTITHQRIRRRKFIIYLLKSNLFKVNIWMLLCT